MHGVLDHKVEDLIIERDGLQMLRDVIASQIFNVLNLVLLAVE